MVTHGEGKEDALNLSAEDGMGTTASCMERNQHEGHGGSGPQSTVEIGGPCGKKGSAQIGTCYVNVGRKNRQNEHWATEDPMGRHVQKSRMRKTVKSIRKLKRME
jgi:nicotinamide mononucleotide (NMN) deamidase PncC